MKIVYCADTIYTFGGLEIVTILKANALARVPGNQVWIVVTDNKYSTITRLEKVNVLDLAVHYYEHENKGYWYAVMDNLRMRKIHRQRLENILNDIQPDIAISTGKLTKFFLPTLKVRSNPVFIRELHTAKNYKMHNAVTLRDKLVAKVGQIFDYGWKIKQYDKIVVLTEADKIGSWAKWDKVVAIPNPITHEPEAFSTLENKVAIAAGRLTNIKNFCSLINTWAKVIQRHPDWTLQIWGEGDFRNRLEKKIQEMGLTKHVFLMGYTDNTLSQMAKASLFVSSSISEGFSLATVEAMAVGLPAVAYNGHGGLRYVLHDGVTGILVPLNDEDTFAEKICLLIEDEELRRKMGQAALEEVKRYQVDEIVKLWMQLFTELRQKKPAPVQ